MRTLIAVPCMDMVHTGFFTSYNMMRRPEDTGLAVCQSSLIYNSRANLGKIAVENGFDRILWLDSDMQIPVDLFEVLSADLDSGVEYVCAMVYTRKDPIVPAIYSRLEYEEVGDGTYTVALDPYIDYPSREMFEIAASGFGAVMMTTALYRRVMEIFGVPFTPLPGMGEDIAFCYRVKQIGTKMYCDSRARPGHLGITAFYGGESVVTS